MSLAAIDRPLGAGRADLFLTSLALAISGSGAVLGPGWAWLAIATAALPIAAFLVSGHLPGRGASVACIALALGSVLIRPQSGEIPWSGLALLGAMASTAWIGGRFADRMAPVACASNRDGRWMHISIEFEGPGDTSERRADPIDSPQSGPERRQLARLARQQRREPVLLRD
jgi:hypothetical protein